MVVLTGRVFALDYSGATSTSDYWKNWIQRFVTQKTIYRASNSTTQIQYGADYYKTRTRKVITPRSWEKETTPQPSTYVPPVSNTNRIYRARTSSLGTVIQQPQTSLKINILPIKQSKDVTELTIQPVRIFQIGLSNTSNANSTQFNEPIQLTQLTFQMYSNTGIAADPKNFSLIVSETEDQSFEFGSNGKVTLRFNNARLAKGDDLVLNVEIKVDNPQDTPHVNGALRVRVLDAVAQTETSLQKVTPVITGTPFSNLITFTPAGGVTGTPIVSGTPKQIVGKTLSAGEKAPVLALDFQAAYDDMLIQDITLHDTLSNNSIDSFVQKIQAIDNDTERVIGEARFTGGKARFHFSRPIQVQRNGDARVYFEVTLADSVNLASQSTQFKLEIAPADVVVSGVGSGNEVPDSNKNFSFQSETFLVVDSGGSMNISASSSQPDGFSAVESLEPVYRFIMNNPGSRDVSIGRLSFEVRLWGVEFPNGISVDDFELKQLQSGREVNGTSFVPSAVNGSVVTFDAPTEFFLHRHERVEFWLKVKMRDIAGANADQDSVAVQLLGDPSLSVGTLSQVRSSGANFIWSDNSGRPHTLGSADWLSGYLVSGIPTGLYRNYRGGR